MPLAYRLRRRAARRGLHWEKVEKSIVGFLEA